MQDPTSWDLEPNTKNIMNSKHTDAAIEVFMDCPENASFVNNIMHKGFFMYPAIILKDDIFVSIFKIIP